MYLKILSDTVKELYPLLYKERYKDHEVISDFDAWLRRERTLHFDCYLDRCLFLPMIIVNPTEDKRLTLEQQQELFDMRTCYEKQATVLLRRVKTNLDYSQHLLDLAAKVPPKIFLRQLMFFALYIAIKAAEDVSVSNADIVKNFSPFINFDFNYPNVVLPPDGNLQYFNELEIAFFKALRFNAYIKPEELLDSRKWRKLQPRFEPSKHTSMSALLKQLPISEPLNNMRKSVVKRLSLKL